MAFNAQKMPTVFPKRSGDNTFIENVVVDPADIGFVMGKGGSTLVTLGRTHNVVITYKSYNPIYTPDVPPMFVVRGYHPKNVNHGAHAIRIAAMENQRRRWMASFEKTRIEKVLSVDSADVGMVIGSKGSTIRTIATNYQVEAFVPKGQTEAQTVNVVVRGYKPSVMNALTKICSIVDESRVRRGVKPAYIRDVEQENEDMYQMLKKMEDEDARSKASKNVCGIKEEAESETESEEDEIIVTGPASCNEIEKKKKIVRKKVAFRQ